MPFVHGKTYSMTKQICEKCHASYGIFGNGTQIINLKTGEEIYHNLLDEDSFKSCFEIAKKNKLHVHVYTDKEIITESLQYMDLRNYLLNGKQNTDSLSFIVTNHLFDDILEKHPPIFKLVLSSLYDLSSIKEKLTQTLSINVTHIRKKEKYKDTVIDKEYEYLDITPKNIGKGYALNYLSRFLQVDTSDIMAIGDNVNDIDMIKASGIGVTLSDSYEEVKKVANYTTIHSCQESGFAEAIYRFI